MQEGDVLRGVVIFGLGDGVRGGWGGLGEVGHRDVGEVVRGSGQF